MIILITLFPEVGEIIHNLDKIQSLSNAKGSVGTLDKPKWGIVIKLNNRRSTEIQTFQRAKIFSINCIKKSFLIF